MGLSSLFRRKAKVLEQTFKNFGFNIKVVEIETGPVIAQYEIELEAGSPDVRAEDAVAAEPVPPRGPPLARVPSDSRAPGTSGDGSRSARSAGRRRCATP